MIEVNNKSPGVSSGAFAFQRLIELETIVQTGAHDVGVEVRADAADGRAVRDAAALAPGAQLVTVFARGSATSTVEATRSEDPEP